MQDSADVRRALDVIGYQHAVRKRLDDIRNPEFWRALNPGLRITDTPYEAGPPARDLDPASRDLITAQIDHDGYFSTPPIVDRAALTPFGAGLARVVGAGFQANFACVYDEYYQLYRAARGPIAAVLGEDFVFTPWGQTAFFVPPGDPARAAWTAADPHRDNTGPDAGILAGRLPDQVWVWIAGSDVTPLDSCIYVVPAEADPDYRTAERGVDQTRFRLKDVRAVPVAAGSVIGFTSHVIHWGSRSSRWATHPRVSTSMLFHRRGTVPDGKPALELQGRVPFDLRVQWVLRSMFGSAFEDAVG